MTLFIATCLIAVIAFVAWKSQNLVALVGIDLQNDFFTGGALGVTDSDEIVSPVNRLIRKFLRFWFAIVIFSRDWHTVKSRHFKINGGTWETHCVQETPGAAFKKEIDVPENPNILSKGMLDYSDAYSAFDPDARIGTLNLNGFLRRKKVKTLYICGLATDFCVEQTVLDACASGFRVYIVTDAMKGVNLKPGNDSRAIEAMTAAGALPIQSKDVTLWKLCFG